MQPWSLQVQFFLDFVPIARIVVAHNYIYFFIGPQLQRPRFEEPWLEVLTQQTGSALQELLEQLITANGFAGIKDSGLPDPWNFPNATHSMLALFQDGEVKTL